MPSKIITERAVIGMFYEALQQNAASSVVDAICTQPFESDQDNEKYAWLGMVSRMKKKSGEKQYTELRDVDWVIDNVEYQNGLRIPKKHILYDKTSQVQLRVGEFAQTVQTHWWELVAPMIEAGESNICYDGQYFFDSDHSEGNSGTQSNSITSSAANPANPTPTEMIDAILAGIEQMVDLVDDQGNPVNEGLTEFLILTDTKFLSKGLRAMSQTNIGNQSNILIEQDSYRFRVHSSPRFKSWNNKFSIFATQGMQKPIMRQQRRPNNAAPGYNVDGMLMETLWLDSEHCKKHDECLVSIETERAVAYGDWKKACLVTLS